MNRLIVCAAVALACAGAAWAAEQTAHLEATADVGISSYVGKDLTSNGQAISTSIRQNQNWSGFESRTLLMNFDTTPVKGWTISKAYLHLYLPKGDLYAVGLSEFLAPWKEPKTENFTEETGGPCWAFAHTPKDREKPAAGDWWAWPGSGIYSVCWAHPSARYSYAAPATIEREKVGIPSTQPVKDPKEARFLHLKLPVGPKLVASLAAGTCHGLILTDDKGQVAESYSLIGPGYPYRDNDAEDPYVFTRDVQEPSLRPRLEVIGEVKDKTAPAAIKDLKVAKIDPADGSFVLEFTAPGDDGDQGELLAYEARVDPTSPLGGAAAVISNMLPRWEMPRPVPAGQKQIMPVWTLTPGTHTLGVYGVDKAGNRGPEVNVTVILPPKPDAKFAKAVPLANVAVKPVAAGKEIELFAVSDLVKVDPVSAAVLVTGEQYRADDKYLRSNPTVAEQGCVTLAAAANEVVAFQLILQKKADKLQGLSVELSDLATPDGKSKIAAKPNVQPFRVWYVKTEQQKKNNIGYDPEDKTIRPVAWHGDACLPLDANFGTTFDLPAADNKIEDQTNQAVWIDIFVPKGTPEGIYLGHVAIKMGEQELGSKQMALKVLPLTLPDQPTWKVDLNCYGGLAGFVGVGGNDAAKVIEAEHSMYRLSKAHRQMINSLPYGQSGNPDASRTPTLKGEGAQTEIADWTPFDTRLGALLDGSAFTAEKGYVGPGAGTPISHIYAPFQENWPMSVEKHFGDYKKISNRLEFAEWAKTSRPLDEAFNQAYKDGFAAVAKQFAEHCNAKGWTGTQFQMFLNNKYYYKAGFFSEAGGKHGSSFWLLDESIDYDDYAANRFFMDLCRKGMAQAKTPEVQSAYRVDVSQPEMTRGLFDNVIDLWMAGFSAVTNGYMTTAVVRQRYLPSEKYWHYGGGTNVAGAPVNLVDLFLTGWCTNSDGILPYWTVLGGKNWAKADDLAVFWTGKNYAGGSKSVPLPVAGVRMKVMRRSQQDVEYLMLLSAAKGWERSRVRLALGAYADDPAKPILTFDKLSPERADELRRAIAATIMEAK